MPSREQLAASNLYRNLIVEIRHRIHVVDLATSNQIPVHPPFVKEICFLQFRMMCELLALGCLAAHGDIEGSKRLAKVWEADKIMNQLEKLNPHFYPIAVIKQKTDGGFHIEPRKIHPLPKDQMLSLYYKCGAILHKGNTKKILSEQIPIQVRYPDITATAQKFRDLITDHMILIKGGELTFLCEVFNIGQNQERVNVAIAERPSHIVS